MGEYFHVLRLSNREAAEQARAHVYAGQIGDHAWVDGVEVHFTTKWRLSDDDQIALEQAVGTEDATYNEDW